MTIMLTQNIIGSQICPVSKLNQDCRALYMNIIFRTQVCAVKLDEGEVDEVSNSVENNSVVVMIIKTSV